MPRVVLLLALPGLLSLHLSTRATAQPSNLFHALSPFLPARAPRRHDAWIHSGKFQGDIDGINSELLHEPVSLLLFPLKSQGADVLFNALKNRQLTWPDGVIPYEMDSAFSEAEVRLIEKAFSSYKKSTCIRFQPRNGESDFLNIVKGYGCYSQVGRTGGKQEISLGRGCLFHEIVVHELMHSVGFWHEHSRSDRDEHIHIKWENILPGMKSQFDKISASLQDLLGEAYDYKSIMHYDSTAFSKNGQNTIETVADGFTSVIGSAGDLSVMDIKKINKLYGCKAPSNGTATGGREKAKPRSKGRPEASDKKCEDHFVDCPYFEQYCKRASFFFVMKSYCPATCRSSDGARRAAVHHFDALSGKTGDEGRKGTGPERRLDITSCAIKV